jgi:hypothetical protein
MYYSYEQLKAEKAARQLEYYKEMEAIEQGLRQPNPALRQCQSISHVRVSKRKLVHPHFKSGL